jgi:hypothetical protein
MPPTSAQGELRSRRSATTCGRASSSTVTRIYLCSHRRRVTRDFSRGKNDLPDRSGNPAQILARVALEKLPRGWRWRSYREDPKPSRKRYVGREVAPQSGA